jgi:hypothetical protein
MQSSKQGNPEYIIHVYQSTLLQQQNHKTKTPVVEIQIMCKQDDQLPKSMQSNANTVHPRTIYHSKHYYLSWVLGAMNTWVCTHGPPTTHACGIQMKQCRQTKHEGASCINQQIIVMMYKELYMTCPPLHSDRSWKHCGFIKDVIQPSYL